MDRISLISEVSFSRYAFGMQGGTSEPVPSSKNVEAKILACLDHDITACGRPDVHVGYHAKAVMGWRLKLTQNCVRR